MIPDNYMKDVSSFQADLEREKVRISSLTNTKDRKKSQKIIVKLEDKIKKKVIFASKYYQEGNAMKYIVFKDVLADWNAENITNELQKNALKFQELADSNIETAIEFTKKGNDSSKEEEKFDNLLKANAYEVLALQNQKKAFDIYAGKTPVKTKQKLASIPKVSKESVTIAKDTMIAVPEEKKKPLLVEEITEEKPVLTVKEEQKKIVEDKRTLTVTEEKPEMPGKEMTKPETGIQEDAIEEKTTETRGLNYGFQILRKSPYSAVNPFPEDKDLPRQLVYRIQVAAFSKPVQYDYFKGLMPITTEKVINTNITRYFAGLFETWEAAQSALNDVRNQGFSDAYIVAYFEGRKVSLNRAKNLENY